MPISFDLNLANVLVLVTSSIVAFIWAHLNQKIANEVDKVRSVSESYFGRNSDRITRIETDLSQVPKKIDELVEGLNRFEKTLIQHYPTRKELDRAIDQKFTKLDEIEKLLKTIVEK